jgi:flagellar hook-associated protein 3 FlgL
MSINRISTGFQTSQSVGYLQKNLQLLTALQKKISSQKNIDTASDDPSGFSQLFNINNTIAADDRYSKNITDAKSELNAADSALKNVTDIISRAKEIGLQGASDTNSTANRAAIAREVDNMINQLVQIGNTKIAGKYIFGGLNTSGIVPPATTPSPIFARTSANVVTFSGTGSGATSYQRNAEISQGVSVPTNVNGFTVFGSVAAAAGPAPPYTAGSGIIRTLTELVNDLNNGNTVEIQARLGDLDTDLNTVLSARAQVGSTVNQLDLTQSRIQDRQTILAQQVSSIQSVDLAKAISDLNYQENAYQSSLGVSARVLQTSLLNYIR